MKIGPPASAVNMPTGISLGASSVRAAASHNASTAPPKQNDAGNTMR